MPFRGRVSVSLGRCSGTRGARALPKAAARAERGPYLGQGKDLRGVGLRVGTW
jgi:hypothetical protein